MYKPIPNKVWSFQIEGIDVVVEQPINIEKVTAQNHISIGRNSDLSTVNISDNVYIGKNCIIENTTIEEGCWISDGAIIRNCKLAKGTRVGHYSVLFSYSTKENEVIDDYSKR